MTRKILLTSFDTWLSHHRSNSSDDLLDKVYRLESISSSLTFLRKLPVDFQLAPNLAIAKIRELQPDAIICCGMAEGSNRLTLESNAREGDCKIQTTVDLERIVSGLAFTDISHDAGNFVCEALYYSVLKYLQETKKDFPQNSIDSPVSCIFVHVPVLTPENLKPILADFLLIIQSLEFC